ncbi:MAG: hypothetical protein WEB06_04200 [Actinomycetota bacterium]
MTAGRRVAAASVAACLACALMFAAAVSSSAGTPIESYRATGEARGLDVAFGFAGSLFERLVDLGLPFARSDLNSEAGGAARGSAAQLFPGDLLVGALGEGMPFYRQAVYPPTDADPEPVDEAHTTERVPQSGVISAGPLLTIENSLLRATASAGESSGHVTTNRVSLGFITIKHLEATSEGHRSADRVSHLARSVARDISIVVSPELTVNIGAVISEVKTSSDGAEPTAESKLTVSDVVVLMSGQRYGATIDDAGIHLDGVSEPVPGAITQDLSQFLEVKLADAGIKIATAETSPKIEDVTGDASMGGLLITVAGTVPAVFTPQIVNDVIYGQIEPKLPPEIQELTRKSICLKEDVMPLLPEEFTSSFPDLPLCVSQNIVPGPGSGGTATFAIGSVRSLSAAVKAVPSIVPPPPPPPPPPGDDGFVPGPDLDAGPVFVDPGIAPQPVLPSQPGPARVRYGLVARMPSEALLGSGIGFLVLAIGVAMGPSLRRWRVTQTP